MSQELSSLIQSLKAVMESQLATLKIAAAQAPSFFTNLKVVLSAALTKLFALMISALYIFSPYVAPSTADPIKPLDPDGVKATFVAIADSQVSNYIIKRVPVFDATMEDIKNAQQDIDSLLIAGDIVENGLACEWEKVHDGLAGTNVKNYIMATGNHDIRLRNYEKTVKTFTEFTNSLNEKAGSDMRIDSLHYTYNVKGYNFIVLGSDRTEFEEAYFNEAQMKWLDECLSRFTKEGKPVFLIHHQPLVGMHGLPLTWGSPIDKAGSIGVNSEEIYNIVNKYDNVIMISGHLHTGFGEYTFDKAGKVPSINLPSLTVKNRDGDCCDSGIGYMVEIYSDDVIFRARNFKDGKYLPDYDITVPISK